MKKSHKEVYSEDGRHRVVVLVDDSARFHLETHAFYEEYGLAGWEDTTIGLHLFASEQAAIYAAQELLRNASAKVNASGKPR